MESDEELAARRIGRIVGRYRLERVLGIGGMAAVYAARAGDGSVAALKILHPEMSVRRDVRERFFREGYVANSIQHPGAVRALEHGEAPDSGVFLALELLNGETLTARFKRHGMLPLAELLDYADQILDVLAVAHQQGIVHRDLKPDNLFVTHEGRIKILDFGLARLSDAGPSDYRTRTGMALGTLPYMAPEQALGRRAEIDHRVDLFAVGATLFRVLSGKKIHEGDSEAELLIAMASKPAPSLRSVAPSVPEELCRVVDLALAFSRDARYPDARTMQRDVRAVRAGERPPYATQRLAEREEKTRTEPMGGPPPSVGPNSTVPLHVYRANTPQGLGATFSSTQNPLAATGAQVPVVPQTAPVAAKAASGKTRLRLLVALALLLLGGGAVAALLAFDDSESPAASASAPLGSPLLSAASARAASAAPLVTAPLVAAAPEPGPEARAGVARRLDTVGAVAPKSTPRSQSSAPQPSASQAKTSAPSPSAIAPAAAAPAAAVAPGGAEKPAPDPGPVASAELAPSPEAAPPAPSARGAEPLPAPDPRRRRRRQK